MTKNVSKEVEKPPPKQSICEQWYRERKIKITASDFGIIINRRKGFSSIVNFKKTNWWL